MKFDLDKAIEILKRTPSVLEALLDDLTEDWIRSNEGENTWSPYDILGHLIHGEKTDWIPRLKLILSQEEIVQFEPFDREAQFNGNQSRPIGELLTEFKELRATNLRVLESAAIDKTKLSLEGIHPEFGRVTMKELLATWVVHDLGHIAQVTRVMAKQYKEEAGPWEAYIGVLNRK